MQAAQTRPGGRHAMHERETECFESLSKGFEAHIEAEHAIPCGRLIDRAKIDAQSLLHLARMSGVGLKEFVEQYES